MADDKPTAGDQTPAENKPDQTPQPAPQPAENKSGEEVESVLRAELERLTKEKNQQDQFLKEKNRAIHEQKEEIKKLKNQAPVISESSGDELDEELVEIQGKQFKKADIENLKVLAKAAGFSPGDELKTLIDELKEVKTSLLSRSQDEVIRKYSASAEEAALIRHHLEYSIKPSGDIDKDVRTARSLALAPLLEKAAADESAREVLLSNFSGAAIGGAPRDTKSSSRVDREAVELLRSIRPDVDWSKKVKS